MKDYWYKFNIEEPIREIVKRLRNNGINTFCSCGHNMWIECQTCDPTTDLMTIFNVLVTMGIKKYKVSIDTNYNATHWYTTFLTILFPDKKGNYFYENEINKKFIGNKIKKGK